MDLIIGLISSFDKLHDISKEIFEKINSNGIKNVYIPSSVFLEYELLLKSRKINVSELVRDIIHFKTLENIKEIPLNSSIIVLAQTLREKYKLTYFDSLHSASALHADGIMISSDNDFKNIKNLKVIEPNKLVSSKKEDKIKS